MRCFNPNMIELALNTHDFQMQKVMECQRSDGSSFSHRNLRAGDPASWSTGYVHNLTADPRHFATSQLHRIRYNTATSPISGWCSIHEFIFVIDTHSDDAGWTYNTSFDSADGWSRRSLGFERARVRRRVWMTTCVRERDFVNCSRTLRSYIHNHPRGECKTGALMVCDDSAQRVWKSGTGVLSDYWLKVVTPDGPSIHSLKGCRVEWLPDNSSDSGHDGVHGFMLREVQARGKGKRVVCVLGCTHLDQAESWVAALAHQLALNDLSFWPLAIGPPLGHAVVMQGDMHKRGHRLPSWKRRLFELRKDGIFSYYKGEVLKGKVRVRSCTVQESSKDRCFHLVRGNGNVMTLRAPDDATKVKWMQCLVQYTGKEVCGKRTCLLLYYDRI
jgi:hypothetical protein